VATPSPTDWISKEEAARILGINHRQLQHRASQGYIEKRFLPKRAHERQARVTYAKRDVEALLAGVPNHSEQLAPVAPESKKKIGKGLERAFDDYVKAGMPPITAEGAYAFPRMLEAHVAALARIAPPRVTKAWLTLEEAVDYSGQTASEIAHRVRDETVYATGRGPLTWRIQRESLDRWGRMDHLALDGAERS
jgi:hypothetical protein